MEARTGGTMGLAEKLAEQLRKPQGVLGRLMGQAMRLGNRSANVWAVSLLEVRPADRILEIGFGPGQGIRRLARLVPRGQVCGVDFSEVMLRQAQRLNAPLVVAGRVDLRLCDALSLPFADGSFDKVLSVNVIYFWPDPGACMMEIRRVLTPGGRVALFFSHREAMLKARFTRTSAFNRLYTGEEAVELLRTAGFGRAWFEVRPMARGSGVCALAEK
jgi:ubiquinone/menaquinone biosynthesis C-methylase UbiE